MKDEQTMILPDTPPFDELAVTTWFGMAVLTSQSLEESIETFIAILRLIEWPSSLPAPSYIGHASIKVWDKKTIMQMLSEAKKLYKLDPLLDKLADSTCKCTRVDKKRT